MDSSNATGKYSGAILAVILLAGIVGLVFIGELPRVLFHESKPESQVPKEPDVAPPIAPPAPPPDLRTQLGAELPKIGLPPSARIIETRGDGDRLTLIFDPALRSSLSNLSALDEWIGALAQRTEKLGYRHLDLRIRLTDAQGRASDVSIDSLVRTPPAKQPRPEPIDDGVRR